MVDREQDLGRDQIDLSTFHQGPLTVIIENLGSFSPDFERGGTLFDYIGHTAAVLGTDMSHRLQIETKATDWEVLSFDQEEGRINVRQVDGEPITPLDHLQERSGICFTIRNVG